MLSVSIHWVNALQALGISFAMSILALILTAVISKRFDRSNGNESGYISFVVLMGGIIFALVLSFLGALFFGISIKLFVAVGIILLGSVIISTCIIRGV